MALFFAMLDIANPNERTHRTRKRLAHEKYIMNEWTAHQRLRPSSQNGLCYREIYTHTFRRIRMLRKFS